MIKYRFSLKRKELQQKNPKQSYYNMTRVKVTPNPCAENVKKRRGRSKNKKNVRGKITFIEKRIDIYFPAFGFYVHT
jgi:hypothetical protein